MFQGFFSPFVSYQRKSVFCTLEPTWGLLIREMFLFVLHCHERACLFGKLTVVRETHIPQCAVHVNCFIPPTLFLLSLLATVTSGDSLTSDIRLTLCLSVQFLFSRVSASPGIRIISPILALSSRSPPRGRETAVWRNEINTELLREAICCEILRGTSAKPECSWQEHNKAAGLDLYFETANKSCKI